MSALSVFATQHIYQEGVGVKFVWQYDDQIVLFTDEGNPIRFWAVNTDGNGSDFSAYGWGLAVDFPYTAYYPRTSKSGNTPDTFLPMIYSGQMQTANASTAHMAEYDYMKSPRTMSTTAGLHVLFEHLGSVIRYEISAAETLQPKTLTLQSGEEEITMGFGNFTVASGDKLIAYMMVPPMTLADGKATLILSDNDGRSATMAIEGSSIAAGKCYPVSLECPELVADEKVKAMPQSFLAKGTGNGHPNVTANDDVILRPTAYAPDFAIETENPLKQENDFLLGDVNNDGKVMVSDAVLLIEHYLKKTTDLLDKKVCDTNRDGNISVADAVEIISIYLKNR